MLGASAAKISRKSLRLEEIRQAMLDILNEYSRERQYASIERRILFAQELESLWYLRSDILRIISQANGEVAAWRAIASITPMFEGYLPRGLFVHQTGSTQMPSRTHRA